MLINFRCNNFRSFRDEVSFSMVKGETKNLPSHVLEVNGVELLKSSAIYGPNAAGKSNIYKAMAYSRDNIITSVETSHQWYYRLEPGYDAKPSVFEYEFTDKGEMFRYGFEIVLSRGEILGEWLYNIDPEGDDALIFRRDGNKITDGRFSEEEKRLLNNRAMRHRDLTLTLCPFFRKKKGVHEVIDKVSEVYDWFLNNLIIIGVNDSLLTDYDYTDEELKRLGAILHNFDIGVESVEFEELNDMWLTDQIKREESVNEDKKGGRIRIYRDAVVKKEGLKRKILVSKYGKNREPFYRRDESDGTKRIFELSPILVKDDIERTYIVDEFDRCLHPIMVLEFVNTFLKTRYELPKQLIFTTHQTILLDQDVLRRDEIWFVEKKSDGHSEMYSLDEYKERIDKNIEKSYLSGRYGAVPTIIPEDVDHDNGQT